MMYPKPDTKKKKNIHDFSAKVKKKEYEDAKGLCRICQNEAITQYHHINEKGMGGGKGLGIQINCLGVGNRCHNHDNTEFLKACDKILEERIKEKFPQSDMFTFADTFIIQQLEIDKEDLARQVSKGFLKRRCKEINGKCHVFYKHEDIKRWLMSKGVVA